MELLELYAEAERVTKPLCLAGDHCGPLADKPYHCCEKQYCDLAAKFARDSYGIDLQPTGHEIPFMGANGCTVPIHLRPVCTLHVCSFTWAGTSTIKGDPEKTQAFVNLRRQILQMEADAGHKVDII